MCIDHYAPQKAKNAKYPKCESFYKEVAAIKKTKDIDLLFVKIDRYQELSNLARAKLDMLQAEDKTKAYKQLLKKCEEK